MFNITQVSEVLKFPKYLFPSYKYFYSQGVRIKIPPLTKTFIHDLVLDKEGYITNISFSSSGYSDNDKLIITLNDNIILNSFLNEFHQSKNLNPLVLYTFDDKLSCIFKNSGPSKSLILEFSIIYI